MVLAGPHVKSMTKINSKNSLYPLRYFTEHMVGVFRKLPQENDLDHESLRLLIRWLKDTTGIQPATTHTLEFNQKFSWRRLNSTEKLRPSKLIQAGRSRAPAVGTGLSREPSSELRNSETERAVFQRSKVYAHFGSGLLTGEEASQHPGRNTGKQKSWPHRALREQKAKAKSRTTNEWQQKTGALDGSGDKNLLSSKVLTRKRKSCLDQIW
jgi:hypothetical protein